MKRLFLILLAVLLTVSVFAQTPEKMSYQAVIRNNSDALVINTQVGMQISVLRDSETGTAVYVETQTPTTNANGLVSIEIGTGNTTDDFAVIDWANGPYFIKTETDLDGGTNYTITGVSQLLSIPYALHAKTAENITETDPIYTGWDKSTGISITETQISDLQAYLTSEVDPQFALWDKSTGIVINESQISDLQTYLTSEIDPIYTGWDKSTGISITETQISDLQAYLTSEVDPQFALWDKSTGIVISESQISDLQTYLTSETDPVYTGSEASNITATDITNLSNLSGVNTGDQDISSLATKTALGDSTAQVRSEIPDVSGFLSTETDPSVPSGTQTGEMQYWNGSEWITVAAGGEGQMLSVVGGVPTWTTVVGITTVGLTDVYNPSTGEVWMDRNLGASQVATSSTDAAAYGDLYQWGRGTDGHQIRTSGTTATLSSSNTPGHGDFILASGSPYDWLSPQNNNLWQGVNGTNNPCPSGYRLPTETEWDIERTSWGNNNSAGAFASPLQLPLAGFRSNSVGSLHTVGSYGNYWSSTVDGTLSQRLYFYSSDAFMNSNLRAAGYSVRCLKD